MKKFFWVYFLIFLLAAGGIISNTVFKEQTSTTMASLSGKDTYNPPDIQDLKDDDHGRSVHKGLELMTHTSEELPNHVGNTLSCVDCHATGTPNRTLTFVGIAKNYPEKTGKKRDLKERINGCMQRSMNGKKLPRSSTEMNAMVDYLDFLSTNTEHADTDPWTQGIELDESELPKASAKDGKTLFKDHCMKCHGEDGGGKESINTPALWGEDSFKEGSGMSRNTMATQFIHDAMPKDDPGSLSLHEAAAVAKYINSHDRPGKSSD